MPEINLDVALKRSVIPILDHGSVKIRSRPVIPKSRMQHAQRPAGQRRQAVAEQPLMKPDCLEKIFRGNIWFVTEG
jgi:hypothetical protein